MDKSELAKMLLQWEAIQKRAGELEAAIVDSVLQLEETVRAGNVTATYRKGRKSYDYLSFRHLFSQELIEQYTTTPAPKTNWRKLVLEGMEVPQDEIPFTEGEPSVSLKM